MATYWVNSAATPAAPYSSVSTGAATLSALLTYINGTPGWSVGDKIFILNTHAPASYGVAQTWTFPTTFSVPVMSVDSSGNLMPTAGNTSKPQEATGAISAGNITMTGMAHFYGLWITVGKSSASSAVMNIGTTSSLNNYFQFTNCLLEVGTTSTQGKISIGAQASAVAAQNFVFKNCSFRFANAIQNAACVNGRISFLNCNTNGGTAPSSVFSLQNAKVELRGGSYSPTSYLVDTAVEDPGEFIASNFYLVSGAVVSSDGYAATTPGGGPRVRATAYGSTVDTWKEYDSTGQGVVETFTDTFLNSAVGMPNGSGSTVKPTMKMTADTSSNVNIHSPLYTPWRYRFIDSTGSKTVSANVLYDSTGTYTNQEAWLEVLYMGNEAVDTTTDLAFRYSGPTSALLQIATGTSTTFKNVNATASSLTGSSTWTHSLTNPKTAVLSATITVDQQGWLMWRVALAKDSVEMYVSPDLTVA